MGEMFGRQCQGLIPGKLAQYFVICPFVYFFAGTRVPNDKSVYFFDNRLYYANVI